MLDRFQQKFVEEAQDNVAVIEEALFELEKSPNDKEIIERLFRAMHTIKGSGAMFGFNDLSHFTHNLETLYDLVRNDKVSVDHDIISLTFESLDYIRQLLDLGEGTLTNPDDIAKQKEYIEKIKKYFPKGQELIPGRDDSKPGDNNEEEKQHASVDPCSNYLVSFFPFESLLKNGTNPLFMLDDLTALGTYKTVAYTGGVPTLEEFEPFNLYTKWQVLLHTDQDVNEIKDVFIFVEDECEMNIANLPKGNIIGSGEKLQSIVDESLSSQTVLKADNFAGFKTESAATDNKQGKKKETAAEKQAEQQSAAAKQQNAKQQDNKIANIRVAADKIDDLVNAVSELVTMQAQLSQLSARINDANLSVITEQIEKITRQLRDNSFSISLIPLQGELVQFQRLVRDLCYKLNKQIEFVVEGGEIELDKNIIDHLKDPLLHIIRNSGDHGIEMPEERVRKGKNPTGIIKLKAFYSGSSVIVELSDDGKGMSPEVIFNKAVEKGLVSPGTHLNKKEILNLIFASGFSTAEKISDVSGRGVGMDVVKSKIAEIRGEVSIDSEVDKGTTITMELPLTLSIIDGLLTKISGEQFVFPLTNIERILHPKEVEFGTSGMGSFFTYEGNRMTCIDLNTVFNQTESVHSECKLLIVGQGDKRVGMLVNEVVGEFQIVVKPIGMLLRSIDMISGAAIMGDGSLSLVIDPGRLVGYYNKQRRKEKDKEEKRVS